LVGVFMLVVVFLFGGHTRNSHSGSCVCVLVYVSVYVMCDVWCPPSARKRLALLARVREHLSVSVSVYV